MHVAAQLFPEQFVVEIDGREADPAEVFGQWTPHDRFGLVVDVPLGGLGASLLLQLAIAEFYECQPERRMASPVYPEIYLFHFGGVHGDFSNFDFWPPRKEVLLTEASALALLEAVNAHGITHLALPDGTMGDVSILATGASTWAEQASARERLRSVHLYGSDGVVTPGPTRITGIDERLGENVDSTLDPMKEAMRIKAALMEGDTSVLAGPSVLSDGVAWVARVEERLGEVTEDVRSSLGRTRNRALAAGTFSQGYRRITNDEALARMAGLT